MCIFAMNSLLEAKKEKVNKVHKYARDGNLPKLKGLITKDKSLVNLKDKRGQTPLHLTTGYKILAMLKKINVKHINTAKFLISKGADLNAITNGGDTVLHYLAFNPVSKIHVELARLLLEKGANPNITNNTGVSPLKQVKLFLSGSVITGLSASSSPFEQIKATTYVANAKKLMDVLKKHGAK